MSTGKHKRLQKNGKYKENKYTTMSNKRKKYRNGLQRQQHKQET